MPATYRWERKPRRNSLGEDVSGPWHLRDLGPMQGPKTLCGVRLRGVVDWRSATHPPDSDDPRCAACKRAMDAEQAAADAAWRASL